MSPWPGKCFQSLQALVSYLQDEEAGSSWIVVVLQLVILLRKCLNNWVSSLQHRIHELQFQLRQNRKARNLRKKPYLSRNRNLNQGQTSK